jgi:hypothetical protein
MVAVFGVGVASRVFAIAVVMFENAIEVLGSAVEVSEMSVVRVSDGHGCPAG